VCFEPITDCFITPCGHNFCKGCIFECINRKHSCPCCNHETIKTQLVKNHHLDNLLSIINKEKDEASKAYFAALINSAPKEFSETTGSSAAPTPPKELSPIETLFHKHMKRSLVAYEEYYQELKAKYEKSENTIKEGFVKQMADAQSRLEDRMRQLRNSGQGRDLKGETDKMVAQLTAECEAKISELQQSFEQSIALLMNSYDSFMKESAPLPSFLPVVVAVVIPSHSIRLDKVALKSTDGVRELKTLLMHRLEELGNPLVSFSKSAVFVLRGVHDQTVLDDEDRPILQYRPDPGSEIILKGEIKLKSDQPKECITYNFQKSANLTCDYFACKECKFNWICRNCATECHRGHTLVEYIKDHKPTWACCYCVKNKTCRIPNSKRKK